MSRSPRSVSVSVRPRYRLGLTDKVLPLIIKIAILGSAAGLGVTFVPLLVMQEQWTWAVVLSIAVIALFVIYLTKRAVPAKYLFPGTALLSVFVILPILLTIQLSTTNFGDGTRQSKSQVIDSLIGQSVEPDPDSPRYRYTVATSGSASLGPFTVFFVSDETGEVYSATDEEEVLVPVTNEVELDEGRVVAAEGLTLLNAGQVNAVSTDLAAMGMVTENGDSIVLRGLSEAYVGSPRLSYDESSDTFTDAQSGTVYTATQVGDREYFLDANGAKLSEQSWQASVGIDNYLRIFTNDNVRSNLFSAAAWTLFFAVFSVGGTFLVGLFAAVAYNHPKIRFQKLQRSLFVIPYAIPTFIGFLVWSTLFNKDFGLINDVLGTNISWMGDPFWAKIAVCIANLWAGFPYMFLITTGALQSLPEEIVEAAQIDGANGQQAFRLIKFPLLLIAVGPLLVASFAFNFNNYNAIQLLTQGGPFFPDGRVFGGTDILISGVYRLAFGERGAELGFASALSVILFIITAIMAVIQFRYTKVLEEVQ